MFKQSLAAIAVFAAFAVTGMAPRAGVQAPPVRYATEWYYADGIIQPDGITLKEAMRGVWAPTKEWMVLFNLSSKDTEVKVTFYFEELAPRTMPKKVRAHSSITIPVHNIGKVVPPNKLYGVRIQSEVPVIVQPTRAEYQPNNPVTAAMASKVGYPGPLGHNETKWAYADGVLLSSSNPLEEWEWITVLNPQTARDAHVKITFNWADEKKTHELTVPAERVRTVDLFNLPLIPKNKTFGAIIESDVPVVVEEVRRCYAKGIPVIMSIFNVIAYPIGDLEIK